MLNDNFTSLMKGRRFWKKFLISGVITVILLLILIGINRYNYYQQNIELGAVAPNIDHWFGTDQLGRDLFSRVAYACITSLFFGITATLLIIGFGMIYGIISGYCGGKIDFILMYIVDILYPIPLTLIAILLVTIIQSHTYALFLAIGIQEWMTTARITRSEVLKIKESGYIQAAKGLGQKKSIIIRIHILPNIMKVITVCFMITLPGVILLESFFSFLGLGMQPPKSSLGILISEGARTLRTQPWEGLFPILIFITIMLTLVFYGDRLKKV